MIVKFLKRRILHYILFGWVSSIRYYLPSITLEQAVKSFHKYNNLDESETSVKSSVREYQRMNDEYNEQKKENGNNETKKD